MSNIDTIRKEVVDYLLERHHAAKKQGEDFFFVIEIIDYDDLPYMLGPQIDGDTSLKILCYGRWSRSPIAYLIITTRKQVFLIGQFEGDHYPETGQVAYNLDQFFENELRHQVRFIEGQNLDGSVRWVFEITPPAAFTDKLNRVFDTIKPKIDSLITPIRNDKYGYYFFDKSQFDKYLKTEPHYTSPAPVIRENLRFKTLRVKDFRGIRQTVIDDLPPSARWIVLTGENGYGKTSVLQAIAAGLCGNYDESGRQLVPDTAFVGVQYYANGEVIETNSRTPRYESASKKLNSELATYGSARLQVSASVTREMLEDQLPTTYHLFNTDGLLLNVEQLLKDTFRFNDRFHKQLVILFKTLIPQLATIRIEVIDELPEILYVEQDETGTPLSGSLTFDQLAAGFRNIIAMVGDMVYRLSIKQKVENLADLQGIVLIDELELHLHPKYQKLLPEVLTRQFPHLQFIVSTHSPIPLLGIPKDAGVVLLHVSRYEETGIVVERLDVDFSVLTPNAILSSPIFGFNDLIPESKPDNQMIQPEDTYAEVEADRELRQTINQFLSPERQAELLELIREK